jgi:hypothetical protein
MPKTVRTADGIEITGIPDDVDINSREVRERVNAARQARDAGIPNSEYRVTAPMSMATEEDYRRMIAPGEITRDMNPWDAFRMKFMEGGRNLGRGLNMPGEGFQEPDAYQRYQSGVVQDRFPVASTTGEIAGEVAPLAPVGMGVSAIPNTALRVLGSGVVGAVEGYGVSRGQGQSTDEAMVTGAASGTVAAGLEYGLPYIGRYAGALYRELTKKTPTGSLLTAAGLPTPEFARLLNQAGISIDDFNQSALSFLRSVDTEAGRTGGVPNQEQALRRARFEELGLESSRGDVTQQFTDQASEARLQSMTGPQEGQVLRDLRGRQSDQFREGIESMADSLGVSDRVGEQIKLALTGRLQLLNEQKNALYKMIAEESPYAAQMPVMTDSILEAMPNPQVYETLYNKAPEKVKQFEDLLIQYGIDQDPDRMEAFISSGRRTQREIFPLNLSNFDDFRQELNRLYDDTTAEGRDVWARMIRPVIEALDGETEIISNSLEAANVTDLNVFKELQRARQLVTEIKTEYNPEDLAAKLIKPKGGGSRVLANERDIPFTEPSQVYGVLMRPTTAPEALERTVDILLRAGEQGRRAMGDLQATAILDAMEQAFKAGSNRESGKIQAVYSNFYQQIKKLDDSGKLDVIFKDNQAALRRLRMFQDAALDLSTNANAMPKGSASANMDMFYSLFTAINSRIAGMLRNANNVTLNAGADVRRANRAARNNPDIEQFRTLLDQQYPTLSGLIGAGGMAAWLGEDEEQN